VAIKTNEKKINPQLIQSICSRWSQHCGRS